MYATFSRLQEIDTMSELQSEDSGITFDEPEAQEAQTVEAEQPEVNEPAALATDSPGEGEENTTDSVEQENTPEWFQKRINKQTFAQRQAEREQALQDTFLENSKKLGVKHDALMEAQNAVVSYGVTPELAQVLLKDSMGALMVQHLAANPLDLHDIVSATPMEAGLLLAEVKTKVALLKPKSSSAPSPATILKGGAVPAKQRGLPGATYE